MTFTVTYRDKNGAKREEALEAVSRAECVAECRKRGILPIAIREGGRAVASRPPQTRTDGMRNDAVSDGAGHRPYPARRILGTLIFLAILGGAVWWWLGGERGTADLPDEIPPKPKVVPKEPAVVVSTNVTTVVTNTPPEVKHRGDAKSKKNRDPAHYRNAAHIGKKRVVHDDGTVEYVGRPTLFKRPFENMLVGITNPNGPAASGIMRLRRRYTDAQIYDMLREPIEIDRTLPDWALEKQIQVQQFKLDLLEYLEQGKTFDEALVEIRMNSTAMHQEYATAKKQLRDLIKSDATNKEIMEFIITKNEDLAAKGVKKLALPYFEHEEEVTTKKEQ